MSDSNEFQDFESICNRKESHVPSQAAVVPSPRAMSSRAQSLRPETWNFFGIQEHVFANPRAAFDSSQTPYQGMLYSLNRIGTGESFVRESTVKPVAGSEERNRETIPTARFARRPSTMNSFFPTEGMY